jgi:hypothetical protein
MALRRDISRQFRNGLKYDRFLNAAQAKALLKVIADKDTEIAELKRGINSKNKC